MERNVVIGTIEAIQKVYVAAGLTQVQHLTRYVTTMEEAVRRRWRIETQPRSVPIDVAVALWTPLKAPAQLLTNLSMYILHRQDTFSLWDVTLSESNNGPILGIYPQADRNIHTILHLIALPHSLSPRRLEKLSRAYAEHILDLKDITTPIQSILKKG